MVWLMLSCAKLMIGLLTSITYSTSLMVALALSCAFTLFMRSASTHFVSGWALTSGKMLAGLKVTGRSIPSWLVLNVSLPSSARVNVLSGIAL